MQFLKLIIQKTYMMKKKSELFLFGVLLFSIILIIIGVLDDFLIEKNSRLEILTHFITVALFFSTMGLFFYMKKFNSLDWVVWFVLFCSYIMHLYNMCNYITEFTKLVEVVGIVVLVFYFVLNYKVLKIIFYAFSRR